MGGYAEQLFVTLRCQFPGKSVPDERPTLCPLDLFVCGTDVLLFLFVMPGSISFIASLSFLIFI